jgi:enoyl-CoA hydratase/carnithine racemase
VSAAIRYFSEPGEFVTHPTSFLSAHDEATGVTTLTLNRPDRMNALTFQVYDELRQTFHYLDTAAGVRAIVLTGTGKAFCTGGDVHDIIGPLLSRDLRGLLEFTHMTCDLILAMRRCRKPIIAALNGTVAGAGAVMATAADLRIAVPSARIAFLFTKVGLSGADMGSAWLLPRIVGLGRATELLMTGAFITAEEAHRIGLYNSIVDAAALSDAARAKAVELSQGPSFALELTKDALNREAHMDLATALESEAQIQAALMRHPDFKEAFEAFRDKRPARFS